MNYYELLGLRQEPFSLLPARDELFLLLDRYARFLRELEIAIWLRRGLSVVTGEVGTGKTTLCLRLVESLREKPAVTVLHVSEPYFTDQDDFLVHLNRLFGVPDDVIARSDIRELRVNLRERLVAAYDGGQGLTALVIDEGQHLSQACLELLRDLLNYEQDGHNLVQVVIFAQLEFEDILERQANLRDRVNLHLRLGSLSFLETRGLVQSRLAASAEHKSRARGLFTWPGLFALHRFSGGRPRAIMRLAHQSLLAAAVRGKSGAGYAVVRQCVRGADLKHGYARGLALAACAAGLVWLATASSEQVSAWLSGRGADSQAPSAASVQSQAGPARPEPVPNAAQPGVPAAGTGPEMAPSVLKEIPASPQAQDTVRPAAEKGLGAAQDAPQPAPRAVPPAPSDAPSASPVPPAAQTEAAPASAPVSVQAPAKAEPVEAAPPVPAQPTAPAEAAEPQAESAPSPEAKPSLNAVSVVEENGRSYLLLQTSQPVASFKAMAWGEPNRYVVDLLGTWDRHNDRTARIASPRVEKVRTVSLPDRLRVEVYLTAEAGKPGHPEVKATDKGLRLLLR